MYYFKKPGKGRTVKCAALTIGEQPRKNIMFQVIMKPCGQMYGSNYGDTQNDMDSDEIIQLNVYSRLWGQATQNLLKFIHKIFSLFITSLCPKKYSLVYRQYSLDTLNQCMTYTSTSLYCHRYRLDYRFLKPRICIVSNISVRILLSMGLCGQMYRFIYTRKGRLSLPYELTGLHCQRYKPVYTPKE